MIEPVGKISFKSSPIASTASAIPPLDGAGTAMSAVMPVPPLAMDTFERTSPTSMPAVLDMNDTPRGMYDRTLKDAQAIGQRTASVAFHGLTTSDNVQRAERGDRVAGKQLDVTI